MKINLIKYYTQQLEKVKKAFPINTSSNFDNDRNQEYVLNAENNLKAVKNGREW